MRRDTKIKILDEIKDEIYSLFEDDNMIVTLNSTEIDIADKPNTPVVDINISQFEGEDGVGGTKEFYRCYVSFHILNPYFKSNTLYDIEEEEIDSQEDRRLFPEVIWDYFNEESRYENFDIIDINMLELIHRYPKQSDVYRFDINIITNNWI